MQPPSATGTWRWWRDTYGKSSIGFRLFSTAATPPDDSWRTVFASVQCQTTLYLGCGSLRSWLQRDFTSRECDLVIFSVASVCVSVCPVTGCVCVGANAQSTHNGSFRGRVFPCRQSIALVLTTKNKETRLTHTHTPNARETIKKTLP